MTPVAANGRRSRALDCGPISEEIMTTNPLDDDDPAQQDRIRERAYHLWNADGRPHGRDIEFWEQARVLVGMEESPGAGQIPVRQEIPEEASLQDNLGEFPGRFTDQGDQLVTPRKDAGS